jgi:hypothetical protein
MRVVQGVSQSLCIGFAGVDLRRALSAKRKAPRSEPCFGLRSNHDIETGSNRNGSLSTTVSHKGHQATRSAHMTIEIELDKALGSFGTSSGGPKPDRSCRRFAACLESEG